MHTGVSPSFLLSAFPIAFSIHGRWTDLIRVVWERVMTWKYPVGIVVTNRGAFNAAGAVGALSVPAPPF